MASDWIKVRTVLPTDGRLRIASRKCHVLPVTVFGALVTLWCLADSHASENGELTGYTCDDIDGHVGVPGFCAAMPSDWIDASGEFVKLPNYQEHNGTTGKTRAQASKRQKAHRDVTDLSRLNRDTSVTREEKRREEEKPKKPAQARTPAIDLQAFLAECEAAGEKPIPADDAVFAYAQRIGLPPEYVALAWAWFKTRYAGKTQKGVRGWRQAFRNAVEGNWPKLWYADDAGGWALTTAGKQAQRAQS